MYACVCARACFLFPLLSKKIVDLSFHLLIIYLIFSIFIFLFQLRRSYVSYIIMNNRFLYIYKIYIKNYIYNIAKIIIIEKKIVFKIQKKENIYDFAIIFFKNLMV